MRLAQRRLSPGARCGRQPACAGARRHSTCRGARMRGALAVSRADPAADGGAAGVESRARCNVKQLLRQARGLSLRRLPRLAGRRRPAPLRAADHRRPEHPGDAAAVTAALQAAPPGYDLSADGRAQRRRRCSIPTYAWIPAARPRRMPSPASAAASAPRRRMPTRPGGLRGPRSPAIRSWSAAAGRFTTPG